MSYEEIMLRAIQKAERFKHTAKPNPVVGAILLKNNEIISEGYHEKFGDNHAEINAMLNAEKFKGEKFNSFSELTLFCTLEPCSHEGKTQSCAKAIAKSGIKNIVIGAVDPNPKVSGKGIEILKKNNLNISIGVHQDLVKKQNKYFFYKHENNKPYILVKIASSNDGKSHYNSNHRTYITSEKSRQDVQILRASFDAILTGGNTLRNDNPQMNARVDFDVNQPEKILLTNKQFNKESQFFNNSRVRVITSSNLIEIIDSFGSDDICSIFVEAGPKLVNSFLKSKIVDELIIYTSQKNLGKDSVPWFKEDNAVENYGFKLESSCKIDNDLKQIYIRHE